MKVKPAKSSKLIKEKGSRRGLVPSSADAIHDIPYNNFLDELNPRERKDVQHALASSSDQRFVIFLEKAMSMSGFNPRMSLAAHAKRCGIGLEEFNIWWRKASTQRALAIMQGASPKIAEHTAIDAQSQIVGCERCDGLGWVYAEENLPVDTPGYGIMRIDVKKVPTTDRDGNVSEEVVDVPVYTRTCPAGCDKGKKRIPGDWDSRSAVLTAAGLINQKGPGIQITQHFGGQAMPSAVSRLDVMTIDLEPENA